MIYFHLRIRNQIKMNKIYHQYNTVGLTFKHCYTKERVVLVHFFLTEFKCFFNWYPVDGIYMCGSSSSCKLSIYITNFNFSSILI
jgi:hypothetical protein